MCTLFKARGCFFRLLHFFLLCGASTFPTMGQRPAIAEPPIVPIEEKSVLSKGLDLRQHIRENLFIRVETDRTSCIVGEGLHVTYKLYTRLKANSQIIRRPSLAGCSVIDMADDYTAAPDVVLVGGAPYYVHLIREVQLFPLQAGKVLLDPAEVESVLHFSLAKEVKPDEFDGLTKHPDREGTYSCTTTVASQPRSIIVKPLPPYTGAAEFTGAIGSFSLSIQAESPKVEPGGLMQVRLVLSGSGNFPVLLPPRLQMADSLPLSIPEVKEILDHHVFPLSGIKTFTYTITAPERGSVSFPPVSWSYFEPVIKKYQTVGSAAFLISVEKNSGAHPPVSDAINDTHPFSVSFYKFFALALILVAIFGRIIYVWVQYKRNNVSPAIALIAEKDKEEPVDHDSYFFTAKQYLDAHRSVAFCQELQQAIWKWLAHQLRLPPSDWDKQKLLQRLQDRNADAALVYRLLELLRGIEMQLYSGTACDDTAMHQFWAEWQQLLEAWPENSPT